MGLICSVRSQPEHAGRSARQVVTITSICDDTASNVSACVCLPKGMFHYVQCNSNTILDVESSELLLACKHLRRRDMVTLYVSSNMSFGIITETKFHTKNSIVASTEPAVAKAAEGGVEDFQPSGTRPSELHTAARIGMPAKAFVWPVVLFSG